jgi:hypothetical protein
LNLFATGGAAWSGTFNIQIWTGVANNAPGTMFLDFYTGTQANIGTASPGTPLTYSYNIGATNTALNASTNYFLVVSRIGTTNGTSLDWGGGPNNTGGTGNVYQKTNGSTNWTDLSFTQGFGAEIVTVPEPGTLLLGGIAAACGGGGVWWRRRGKAKAAETVEQTAAV